MILIRIQGGLEIQANAWELESYNSDIRELANSCGIRNDFWPKCILKDQVSVFLDIYFTRGRHFTKR